MALIESTNDYFEQLMELIEKSVQPNRELSKQMMALYRELVGIEPDPTKAEGLLNDAYAALIGDKPLDAVRQFIGEKGFVVERIKERAPSKLLFRQPSILLTYLAVSKRPGDAKEVWPLTPSELKPNTQNVTRPPPYLSETHPVSERDAAPTRGPRKA